MRIPFPYGKMRALDDDLMSVGWLRWFRQLWESFGWNKDVPVYSDLDLTLIQRSNIRLHNGNLWLSSFEAGVEGAAKLSMKLPNHYKDGSNLQPYIEWMPNDNAGGNVVLEFGYAYVRADSATAADRVLGNDVNTQRTTVACPATAKQVTRTAFTAIDGSAFEKGDSFAIQFARIGDDAADTYATGILVLGYGIKTQIEGIGHEKAHP